jgi:hypothetical protein
MYPITEFTIKFFTIRQFNRVADKHAEHHNEPEHFFFCHIVHIAANERKTHHYCD